MDLIILYDGLFHLVPVTKAMTEGIELFTKVDCFNICDILRVKLSTYAEPPLNQHVMNDGSGDFYGCICN
jgi:hypothetical protein